MNANYVALSLVIMFQLLGGVISCSQDLIEYMLFSIRLRPITSTKETVNICDVEVPCQPLPLSVVGLYLD